MASYQFSSISRRRALWLATGAIAGLGLHACGSSSSTSTESTSTESPSATASPATETSSLSMGITTWIGTTPLYIGLEKGFFQELGLDLQLQVFDTVAQGFPAFLAGKLDGLAPVTSEAVALAAEGADFRVVLVEDTSLGADVLLARNSVTSLEDLKGRQIGAELGGIGHFFVLQILDKAGLTEDDVTIVNIAPDAAAAAYQKGDLEVVYTYSPFSDQAIAAQKDGRVLFSSKDMPTAIADLYVFSTSVIESNPTAVAAFVEGHFKALDFLKTNPDEGLAIMANQLGITPEELDAQLQGIQIPDLATNVEMLGNPDSDLSLTQPMAELASFLKNAGKISDTPDMPTYLDPQFVKALQQG